MTREEMKQEAEIFAKTEMSHPNEYGMYYYTFLKVAEPREKRIAELEAQIEKMKCCGNCNHFNKESDIEYCQNCERQLVNSLDNFSREEIIKDEWELRR